MLFRSSSIEVIEDLCQEFLSDKLNNQNHQDISFKEKIENNFSNTSLMELRCNVVFLTFKDKLLKFGIEIIWIEILFFL